MGKINVVTADGRTVSVDEKDYLAAQKAPDNEITLESPDQVLERLAAEEKAQKYSGAGNAVAAATFAGIDTMTGGIAGKVVGGISDRAGKEWAGVQQARPGAAAVGAAGAMLLPTGVVGAAGRASKTVTASTGSRVAGLATEGVILGAGSHVAGTNVSGDQLSVEGLAEDMSLALMLNVGIGKAADKLKSVSEKAKKGVEATGETFTLDDAAVTSRGPAHLAKAAKARQRADAAAAIEADAVDKVFVSNARKQAEGEVKAVRELLDESPAYAAYRDAHNGAVARASKANAAVQKEVDAYAKFATPKGLDNVLSGYEKAQATIRERMKRAAGIGGGTANAPKGTTIAADADSLRLTEMEQAVDAISKLKASARGAAQDDSYEAVGQLIADTEKRVMKLVPDVQLPQVPAFPGQLTPVSPKLPDRLTELTGKHGDTLAQIANATDDMSKAELDKLAAELGLSPGETAGDTLSQIQKEMKSLFGPRLPPATIVHGATEVEKAAAKTQESQFEAMAAEVDALRAGGGYRELTGMADDAGGWVASGGAEAGGRVGARGPKDLTDRATGVAKRGVKYGLARYADTGGIKGAFFRTLVGGGTGYALDGLEGAIAGNALVNGRLGLKAKVSNALAKYGTTAANILGRLGPVAASAATRFPSGEPDDTEDPRDLVMNRVKDVQAMEQMAPDLMYDMVKPLMGMPGDVAYQMHQKHVLAMQYLSATAPKDPGIDITASGSNWRASYQESDTWAHRYEATMDPVKYAVRTLAGDGHPAGIESLAVNWPAFLQETIQEAAMKDWSDLTLEQHRGLSMLFGRPMSALQHPEIVLTIQGQFLPRQDMAAQTPGNPKGGSGGSTGNPNGRPPAVQSQVAGSNVDRLT